MSRQRSVVERRDGWKRTKVSEAKHKIAAAAAALAAAELRTDMVTTTDLAAFQQRLRQATTDVIQHLRIEVNETVSGRIKQVEQHQLPKVSANPIESKPYRISNLIPRSWEGSNDQGKFRNFMSDLHLWMQPRSGGGETMIISVENTDKVDNSTLAVDCSDEEINRGVTSPSVAQNG